MFPKVTPKKTRIRKGVTLGVKLDIIRRFDRGERNRDIVKTLNLPASTIHTIYAQREKILKAASNFTSSKTISLSRHAVMDQMEAMLLEWINDYTKCGIQLSYALLKEKSLSLFEVLKQQALDEGDETVAKVEFKGSHGWFHRFLKRGQLHSLKVAGESALADNEETEKFPEELKKIITEGGYSYKQVFNCDETAIYWKKLPSKTFLSVEEKQFEGHKPSKDKFTLMPIINANGDAVLKPLLVYHSENPRALRGVDKNTLPVVFRSHPSSKNTQVIFSEYMSGYVSPFFEKYARENKLDNRCLILVDNCASHPPGITEYGGNIRVVFLPPTKIDLQPSRQGLLATIKAYYTESMFRYIITAIDREGNSVDTVREIWNNYDMKYAIASLGDALDRLTATTRNNVWRKLCPEAVRNFKNFKQATLNHPIVTLAKDAGFIEVDEDNVEQLLASHDEDLTEEELKELQKERIRIETERNSERPECEALQELEAGHLSEIFATIEKAALIAEKFDFNFERSCRFRAGLDDVMSVYKELYNRKMGETKQSSRLSYFKPPSPIDTTVEDNDPPALSSKQADLEENYFLGLGMLKNLSQ